jgi:hypothetical protein
MDSSCSPHNGAPPPKFQPTVGNWRERERENAERNRKALEASERARFRFTIKIVIACFTGTAIGAVPMAWALHTNNKEQARLWWSLGPVLGQSIVVAVLIYGWIRWSQDDW